MKKYIEFIRRWMLVTCCSFTVEILSFTLLGEAFVPALTTASLQQTFLICVCASCFGVLVLYYDFQHVWSRFLAVVFAVVSTVYVMGTLLFALIPIDFGVYMVIIVLCMLTYLICSFLFYRKNQSDADAINEQLQRRDGNHE